MKNMQQAEYFKEGFFFSLRITRWNQLFIFHAEGGSLPW